MTARGPVLLHVCIASRARNDFAVYEGGGGEDLSSPRSVNDASQARSRDRRTLPSTEPATALASTTLGASPLLRRRRAITESRVDRGDPSPGRRGLTHGGRLCNRDGPAPRAPQACHCHETTTTAAREFSFQAASHGSNARGRGVSGGSTA